MAEVTGKTSIKIDELVNGTIVSGKITNGHLILSTRGGAEIDAGVLTGSGSISALDFMPIGYIYMSVDATSPETLFGGSWVRIAQGRVLIGQDSSQTEFDVAEETGGEKTHTITVAELPAHTHTLERKTAAGTSTGVVRGNASAQADGTTATAGTGVPANNLQPYLVVYMWKRIASIVVTKYNGIAPFSGQSSLTANGKRKARAIAVFMAQSSLTVTGTIVSTKKNGIAHFTAASSLTANGKRKARGIAAFSSASSLTVNGTVTHSGNTYADIAVTDLTPTSGAGVTSLGITLPAGLQGGDYMVLRFSTSATTTLSAPDGFAVGNPWETPDSLVPTASTGMYFMRGALYGDPGGMPDGNGLIFRVQGETLRFASGNGTGSNNSVQQFADAAVAVWPGANPTFDIANGKDRVTVTVGVGGFSLALYGGLTELSGATGSQARAFMAAMIQQEGTTGGQIMDDPDLTHVQAVQSLLATDACYNIPTTVGTGGFHSLTLDNFVQQETDKFLAYPFVQWGRVPASTAQGTATPLHTPPSGSGWTRLVDHQNTSTSSSVYVKYAEGSVGSASSEAGSTVTVTFGASGRASASGVSLRGVNQTTALDVAGTTDTANETDTSYSYPALTTATDKVVLVATATWEFTGTSLAWTQPSGFTHALLGKSSAASGNNSASAVAVLAEATAGPHGPFTDTWSVANASSVVTYADLLAIRPASSGVATIRGSVVFSAHSSIIAIAHGGIVKYNGIARFSASTSIIPVATVIHLAASVKLSWMSDIQGDAGVWTTDMANMLSRLNTINPDYLITGGDMAGDGLTAQYNTYGDHMSAWYNKTLPVNGNHDNLSASNADLVNYWAYWGTRTQAIRAASSSTQPWWSIDIGGWHLIGLSIASGGSRQPAFNSGSAQYNWLSADLAANAAGSDLPIAAFWHMPRYADHGGHGDTTTMVNIAQLLYNAGCKFTVHGHIHNNERFPPADFDGNLQADGSIEFTSSGVNWDEGTQNSVLTPDWRDTNGTVQANMAMLTFTLTPTSFAWDFIRVSDGQSLDNGSIDV